MFLARRKEIEEKMEKANYYENYIKTAEIRDESVLRIKDVVDVMLNGKLTGTSTRNVYEKYIIPWDDETYHTALCNMKTVHAVLRRNVPVAEYMGPTLGIRLSARQGHTAENVILCMAEGRMKDAVSEFIDCLMNDSNPENSTALNEHVFERKLSINEVILLETISLAIAKFSTMNCTV